MRTELTPARAAMIMMKRAARKSSETLARSSMPSQRMTSGISASGGIGRMNSTIGSSAPRQKDESPMAKPIGMPTTAPRNTPCITRFTEVQTWSQSATLR